MMLFIEQWIIIVNMVVRIKYSTAKSGNVELGKKLNELIRRIESEPRRTIQSMAADIQYHAMMIAPIRTGALANSIKLQAGRNWANVVLTNQTSYGAHIDRGTVPKNWGVMKRSGMIDMRDREDKLYFFVGTESNEGKTLQWARKNVPRYVESLKEKLKLR